MPCTTGISIKPLAEEAVIDKQWLNEKKAWMIKSVEIEGDQLKVNLISGDIRMLIWGYKTKEFSNIEVKRVISLLGRTTHVEKLWRERLDELIIHREDMKLKKKRLKQKYF